jgi:hypothetical protein
MANTTWNPSDKTASVTLTGSNLIATSSTINQGCRSADGKTSGKYYWEITCNTFVNASSSIGVANTTASLASMGPTPTNTALVYPSGNIWLNNVATGFSIGSVTNGTVIGIALDRDNQRIWFRKGAAGLWNGNASHDPATNTGVINTTAISSTGLYAAAAFGNASEQYTANFGDTAFVGTVPSGFTPGFPTIASSGDARVTQVGLETWLVGSSRAIFSQAGVEVWQALAPPTAAYFSQAGIEVWQTLAPPTTANFSQVGIEVWQTLTPPIPPVPPAQARAMVLA